MNEDKTAAASDHVGGTREVPDAGAKDDGAEDENDEDEEESPILPSSTYEHLVCRSCVLGSEYLRAAAGHEGWMMVVRSDEGGAKSRVATAQGHEAGAADWKDGWSVLGRGEVEGGASGVDKRLEGEGAAKNPAPGHDEAQHAGMKRKPSDDPASPSEANAKRARTESLAGGSDQLAPLPASATCSRLEPLPAIQALLARVEDGDYSMTFGDIFIEEGLREKICVCDRVRIQRVIWWSLLADTCCAPAVQRQSAIPDSRGGDLPAARGGR